MKLLSDVAYARSLSGPGTRIYMRPGMTRTSTVSPDTDPAEIIEVSDNEAVHHSILACERELKRAASIHDDDEVRKLSANINRLAQLFV